MQVHDGYRITRAMKSGLVVVFACSLGCRHEAPLPARRLHVPSVGVSESVPDAASPGGAVGGNMDPPAPATAFHDVGLNLPQGTVGAWSQSGAVRYFTPQTIFQEMDGAGDAYNAYGFRALAKTDYRRPGTDVAITAEVYDMGSPLGAFGRYSLLLTDSRDPATMAARSVPLGGGGFLGTSQAVFWKGSYLVELNLEDEGGTRDEAALSTMARDSLLPIGSRIAALIPGDVTPPPAPTALPTSELVWGGITYVPDSALDFDHTGPAWVGHYGNAAGQRYRIAVLVRTTPAESHAAYASLRTGTATVISGVGDEASALSGPHGDIVVARRGTTVLAVASPVPSNLTALPHAAMLDHLRTLVSALP